MKKLILSTAILLGGLSMHAATSVVTNSIISVNIQDEYTEITADAVPAAVKSTIEKSFVGSKLEKAWKNAKDEYKLEISKEGKKYTFFTDASGNIIKK
jgi:hypothetical protein